MADGNAVRTDAEFFDQQSHDLLPIRDLQGVGMCAQTPAEVGQGFTNTKVVGLIGGGRGQPLNLGGDRLLLFPEYGHPVAQFVQREELTLIGRDQALHTLCEPDLLPCQFLGPLPRGIRPLGRVPAALEFGFDEGRIVE
jgi:hypothetical protein